MLFQLRVEPLIYRYFVKLNEITNDGENFKFPNTNIQMAIPDYPIICCVSGCRANDPGRVQRE